MKAAGLTTHTVEYAVQAGDLQGGVHFHKPSERSSLPRVAILFGVILTIAICAIAIKQWVPDGLQSTVPAKS